jgi:hypothetical protein
MDTSHSNTNRWDINTERFSRFGRGSGFSKQFERKGICDRMKEEKTHKHKWIIEDTDFNHDHKARYRRCVICGLIERVETGGMEDG